jgi:K+-transporting ATPase ATPase C chain
MNTNEQTLLGQIRPAIVAVVIFSVLTGLLYPLGMTAVCQVLFSKQANGSIIEREGKAVGSELIGQAFSNPKYFWSRPSATGPVAYNAGASTGSNFGPLNPALIDRVKASVDALRKADPQNTAVIPVDLITSSASGLDPHISPAAAEYQAARVARVRGLPLEKVHELVSQNTKPRQLGFLGERVVNVLELNLALDGWRPPIPHSWKDPI